MKPALTPRERDVLQLIVKGMSNKQISRELGLEVNTIKRHVVRLYESIGVHSRVEAAVWYMQEEKQHA